MCFAIALGLFFGVALLYAGLRFEEAYFQCFLFGFSGWGPRGGFPVVFYFDSKGAKVLESQVEKSMEKPLRNSRTEKYKQCLDHKPWITRAVPKAPLQNNNKEALLRSAGYER